MRSGVFVTITYMLKKMQIAGCGVVPRSCPDLVPHLQFVWDVTQNSNEVTTFEDFPGCIEAYRARGLLVARTPRQANISFAL